MTQWRYKPVGSFPPEFHRAMEAGLCKDRLIKAVHTPSSAKRLQVEWQIFRYSLRFESAHPLYRLERDFNHRTRIARNSHTGLWELLLTTNKSLVEELKIPPELL